MLYYILVRETKFKLQMY